MYLPACRIIQMGGRSHCSPLIVRTMSGSPVDAFTIVETVDVLFACLASPRFLVIDDDDDPTRCAHDALVPIIIF